MKTSLSVCLAVVALSGCTALGAAAAEEPSFKVLKEDGNIQIREYGELLVARTTVAGDHDEIGSVAFRRLAGYIFGDNQPREKIAMTAPVLQEEAGDRKGEKIAMTAPVLQEPAGESWVMTFVMPAEYTLETLPRPLDPLIEIATIPPKRVASIRFSGLMNRKKLDRYSAELLSWLDGSGYVAVSPPRSAGYNPPWTLPFLRRNEIHIDVE